MQLELRRKNLPRKDRDTRMKITPHAQCNQPSVISVERSGYGFYLNAPGAGETNNTIMVLVSVDGLNYTIAIVAICNIQVGYQLLLPYGSPSIHDQREYQTTVKYCSQNQAFCSGYYDYSHHGITQPSTESVMDLKMTREEHDSVIQNLPQFQKEMWVFDFAESPKEVVWSHLMGK